MHDTIEFEKRGIPATVVITTAFHKAAEFQFRGRGMGGHPFVALPHPVSNLKPEEIRALTLRHVNEVVSQLVAPGGSR